VPEAREAVDARSPRGVTGEPFHGPLPFRQVEYVGSRAADGTARVFAVADGVTRRLRHKVYHSPTGFEWGYGGSGPADLARSLLLDFLGFDPEPAVYQTFKFQVIARLPALERWRLDAAQLRDALRAVGAELRVSCLRCLDDREVRVGLTSEPCPVCRQVRSYDVPITLDDERRR